MNDSSSKPRLVRCPRCGTPTEYSAANAHRPFCSERCRVIDLGAWAEGSYAIPAAPTAEDLERLEQELDVEPEGDPDPLKH